MKWPLCSKDDLAARLVRPFWVFAAGYSINFIEDYFEGTSWHQQQQSPISPGPTSPHIRQQPVSPQKSMFSHITYSEFLSPTPKKGGQEEDLQPVMLPKMEQDTGQELVLERSAHVCVAHSPSKDKSPVRCDVDTDTKELWETAEEYAWQVVDVIIEKFPELREKTGAIDQEEARAGAGLVVAKLRCAYRRRRLPVALCALRSIVKMQVNDAKTLENSPGWKLIQRVLNNC